MIIKYLTRLHYVIRDSIKKTNIMPRPKKTEELTKWVSQLSAFTYSIQKPGTIFFHHTVLEKTEQIANEKLTELYPGAKLILVSSSKRVTA